MSTRWKWIAAGAAALVFVLSVAFFGIYAVRQAKEAITPRRTETQLDLGSVVTRVRDLNRLETAAMHIVHVGTVTQSYKYVPDSLGGDAITLMSAGDVIAGVDLSTLKPTDIRREPDGTVVLRLPSPVVLVTRVDNNQTKVINRKTGVFRRADANLEGRARLWAEGAIRSEAIRKGILPLAAQNAEQRLAGLLHSLGVEHVRFEEPGQSAGS